MPQLEKQSANRVSNGTLTKYSFPSSSLGGLTTSVNVFVPGSASSGDSPAPVLLYLAGLTCNEDTGAQKGGFLNTAGEQGIAVVFPDTSPRGAGVEGEDDDWQLGTGAGFYINATDKKWANYKMYDLVVKEIPEVLKAANLGLDWSRVSIFGHSMGGHGALMIYLKNPGMFKSASAFAPACNPSRTPWGKNAFGAYINPSTRSLPPVEWLAYDSSHLLSNTQAAKGSLHVLVDVGTEDKFLKDGQLEPQALERAAQEAGREAGEVQVRMQDGFDHSYYFISTFAPEHVKFHAKYLKA